MTAEEFTALLEKLNACSEAVEWRGERTLKQTWEECLRGDWMLWLCGKMQGEEGWPSRQEIVLAACDCAELILPIFEKKYSNDDRPRKAIETARLWAIGKATIEQVREARNAANAYAYAADANAYAAAAAAANAAYAADAAYAAAYVAYAAYAADAASDAVAAAARKETQLKCAEICRKRLKVPF